MESRKRTVKKKKHHTNPSPKQKKKPQKQEQSKKSQQKRKKRPKGKSKKALIEAQKRRKKQKRKYLLFEFLGAIAITSILVLLMSVFLFSLPKVEGYSMVSTLRDGDRVYVNKIGKLKTFELVYVQIPGTKGKEVRRIIGMPGQKVTYKNDQLQIDGQDREEKFIFDEKQTSQENGRLYTDDFSIFTLTGVSEIPEGKYLVLGDNRPYSVDSRQYGLIDQKDIIGVVEMRILPLHLLQSF
ncbi:signal peptidase I [Enterococcus sp. DIV0840]|uniref:signal peptidase I n=1 Tax=Enterococcus TaxID=1350 RepID=UPI001A907B87|nr:MULTISPECIES: signal peptidase I [Enterococcus]MBO0435797.1 signal peptidase I [Enterococcus sp. DIV0849a]MBO0475300.1 signal peptidase I [Enterococcus ureasiticus]